MCGRYTLIKLSDFTEMFPWIHQPEQDLEPRYNIAPSTLCPVVRLDREDQPGLSLAKWGLIPSWTKGDPKLAPINAKCETAATSGMFRQAMERRRCLVPADGFYEWQGAKPPKQPHFIRLKQGESFCFAGLWERWKPDEQSEAIDTFTILTTSPNELMKPLHNRMPVILAKPDYPRWLSRENKAGDVADLLEPFPAEQMEAWPVSTKVNAPKNEGKELTERIT